MNIDITSSEINTETRVRIKRAIGGAIKKARKEKGMTQEELAAMVNSTGEHISKIERGLVEPKIILLFHISFVLGTTLNDLVQGQRLSNRIPMNMNEDLTKLSERQINLINVIIREMIKQNND